MSGQRTRRGRATAAAAGGLLLAVVVGAVGYTVDTVKDADRASGAPVWTPPGAPTDDEKEAPATGLSGALVPYRSDGWTRGPDLGEFGADAALTGAHAAALTKESLSDLPRSQRKELEKEIDRLHITGVAMRSYATTGGLHSGEQTGAATLSIVLTRMDRRAARSGASDRNEAFESLDVFEAGPSIKGHKNARCYRLPGESDEELDVMFCTASQGDVLVSATAEGVRPFGAEGVAALLTEQLDRLGETGVAV
ncbi:MULTISPECIES: hypothetical protein [Streptomyces violaceoruber group]|uniref:Uncharacterized protein n=2 Tax=Streptomyces violaceoruber group TaxID=2867121 RepID=A0ACD4WNR0_STRVN|nr:MULTISPECIES: hypothetical protein [Streptomyces anthocyanicus group]WOY99173.1 hypothetical protein R2E43_17540 [Streptomyces violaceoruber]BDD73681.1 hypothetical protein JCM4020_43010 [Streptomyces coelicolor]MCW8122577.1 hypothetical protein [Streptomyces anthocyanicus]MCZ4634125.1 hypothetical protein [Streptomyces rubrogriseus]WSB61921.1 hypothetical protein OIE72_17380 [Streptomyces anthocyanicus]